MLIRLYELNYTDDDGIDDAKFIAGYEEVNFDKVALFLLALKGKRVIFGGERYMISDYAFRFPESKDNIPSLDIYVYSEF